MFILHFYEVYFFGGRGAKEESEGIDYMETLEKKT